MSDSILICKNLSFAYHTLQGEIPVIEDISFSVSQGEFVSIIGPSGCGKSTLLNLLTGLSKPESGEILTHYPDTEMQSFFGYMFQQDQLFEWYDIWENICIGPKINHCLTNDCRAYLQKLLQRYQLSDFMYKKPSQLSGCMRQRAALIRTLAMKPELLFLDEPFSALDYQSRLHAADDIGRIIRLENKTAVLVTHDIGEAISLSDRILVLSKRPTKIIYEKKLPFQKEKLSSLQVRNDKRFSTYFDCIWKELNNHEN